MKRWLELIFIEKREIHTMNNRSLGVMAINSASLATITPTGLNHKAQVLRINRSISQSCIRSTLSSTIPASAPKLTRPDVKNFRVTYCEMQFPRIHGAPISYTATRLSNYYARNVQPSNRIRRARFPRPLPFPPRRPPPLYLSNEIYTMIRRLIS